MTMHLTLRLLALVLSTLTLLAAVEDTVPPKPDLHPQTGVITVGDNLATITLPKGTEWYGPKDAQWILEKAWGNPPDSTVLGMIRPANQELQEGWGMIASWDDSGYVADSDAAETDFNALLTTMQESTKENKPMLKQRGYPTADLLGWAEPPHYDSSAKTLYWAKNLRFDGQPTSTLNYCVRVLGARGVLELNTVDSLEALPAVRTISKEILIASSLNPGHRYADHKPGVDPVQAGGIAALIAGGLVAKKLGMLALFGVFLLKAWKFLIIPALFIGHWVWKRKGAKAEATRRRDGLRAKPAPEPSPALTVESDARP